MFLSSSVIITEVKNVNNINEKLKDIMFTDDNDHFYSMNFYKHEPNKQIGEIEWSNSFQYGKMNVVHFIRKKNTFYLFTSSIQNYKYLEILIRKLLGDTATVDILKIPLNCEYNDNSVEEIKSIEIDPYFGIKSTLLINERHILLKLYTNGLTTYTQTNDYKLLKRILDISTCIIKKCDRYE